MNNLLAGGGVPKTITNPVFLNTKYDAMVSTEGGGSIFLGTLLPSFIGFIFIVGSVAFFFIFATGAISWILSGGDKAHIESSKSKITNALIGLVLLIGSFAIIKLIESFFGIKILSIDIGPLVI